MPCASRIDTLLTIRTSITVCPVRKIIFLNGSFEKPLELLLLTEYKLKSSCGTAFFLPVVGQSVFVENEHDDDRINNYAFI